MSVKRSRAQAAAVAVAGTSDVRGADAAVGAARENLLLMPPPPGIFVRSGRLRRFGDGGFRRGRGGRFIGGDGSGLGFDDRLGHARDVFRREKPGRGVRGNAG